MFGLFGGVKDPVCGMKVDKKSQFSTEFKGQKYYFCSENCLNQFKGAPEKYVTVQSNHSQSCCH
ncbi:YHS domain-containing protein [Candidatus Daviesbacteria bacterium]|nr:YHS domain-containing protein [Candidatus Daviesbacteria bacterium]